MAKSYKIIFLITAFILSLAIALGFMGNAKKTYADQSVANYFDGSTAKAAFSENGLVLSGINKDDTLSFKNDLVLNNLSLELVLPENLNTVISFSSASYYVNGNPKVDGENKTYEKQIENKIILSVDDDNVKAIVNGVDKKAVSEDDIILGTKANFSLNLAVKDNYLTVADGADAPTNDNDKNYYKIQDVANAAIANDIKISFEAIENKTAAADEKLVIKSIDQNRDKEGFKQVLSTEGVNTKASSRVILDKSWYTKDNGEYKINRIAMDKYENISYKTYNLFGGENDLYIIDKDGDVLLESAPAVENKPKKLCFNQVAAGENDKIEFALGKDDKEFETFVVEVKEAGYKEEKSAQNAPKYIDDQIALDSFKNALKEVHIDKHDDGSVTSKPLGTSITLPSFEDLVEDNFTSYSNLQKTVYYKTIDKDTSASGLSFTIDSIGNYMFYVVFSDGTNSMKKDDFIKADENDPNSVTPGTYAKYIFDFNIKDDAHIKVEAPIETGTAWTGIKFTASKFIIDAKGCSTTYSLFYNANKDAGAEDENWIEIPKASSITDKAYDKDGFKYDEIQSISYDGELTFTPSREGAYKIVCKATSEFSARESEAASIIKAEAPKTVKIPSTWLKDHMWSVVFLGISTLCLIGIIVLLCIKPKEDVDKN